MNLFHFESLGSVIEPFLRSMPDTVENHVFSKECSTDPEYHVERRRVVVLQDIMIQPPAAAPIPPPGMTSTQEVAASIPPPGMTSTQEVAAPDLKFFFEDFKPTPEEEEIDPPLPPTLSTFRRPTSSSAPPIEDLLNVYNPDLDESLTDLSHLHSFLSNYYRLSIQGMSSRNRSRGPRR
ncbi:uncharacterized protein [Leptinotarsa decemlineata]|uniref:uncharacterized protein n=1 Tax=Leptinotarsa decemlineata TaxID=7539 RepID=UPI003D3075BE